jgi:hypothetical protein
LRDLAKAEQGGQVAKVDASDKIIRRYSLQERRTARATRCCRFPCRSSVGLDERSKGKPLCPAGCPIRDSPSQRRIALIFAGNWVVSSWSDRQLLNVYVKRKAEQRVTFSKMKLRSLVLKAWSVNNSKPS